MAVDLNTVLENLKDQIFDALQLGPKTVIGIDIGSSSVKACEIQTSGDTFKIVSFSVVELDEGTIIEDEIQKEDELIRAIQEAVKSLRTSCPNLNIGVAGPNTVMKRLQLPGGILETEIEDQVSWEIEQFLPYPIEDGTVSHHVLGENQGGGIDVVICSVRKDILHNFKSIAEKTNLKVKIIELNITALLNVLEVYLDHVKGNHKQGTWIVLDIGTQRTGFLIYKNGIPIYFKEINIAGLSITEEIQRQLGVNHQEAEDLKVGNNGGGIPEEVVEIINQVSDGFFTEVKRSLDFYITSTTDDIFDGCIITGGSTLIDGLDGALQELLGTEIEVLNPLRFMTYSNSISDELLSFIQHRGVVACGLAMRKVSSK